MKEQELAVKQREDAAISKAASLLRESRSVTIQRRKIEEMLKVRKELAAESANMKTRELNAKRDEEQNELVRKELAAESTRLKRKDQTLKDKEREVEDSLKKLNPAIMTRDSLGNVRF